MPTAEEFFISVFVLAVLIIVVPDWLKRRERERPYKRLKLRREVPGRDEPIPGDLSDPNYSNYHRRPR